MSHDGRPMRPENAGLLRGNLVQSVTEPCGVVHADGSHYRNVRVQDIDGVQPSAETHFQDRNVRLGADEEIQGGQGAELEIAQDRGPACPIDALKGGAQGRIPDCQPVQADTLVVAQQVGGGITGCLLYTSPSPRDS